MAPTNKAAETAAPGITLTDQQFAQLLEAARGGAPAAEAAPPKVEETAEERQARLIGEAVAKAMEDVKDDLRAEVQMGGAPRIGRPTRKTLEAIAEVPDKPLHELSGDDFNKAAEQGFAAALGINIE